jgi:serpin B
MKRFLSLVFLSLSALAATLPGGCGPRDKPPPQGDPPPPVERPARADDAGLDDVKAVAHGNNAFAFDLLRKLGGDGNLFFSPLSLSTALSMTYAGARGDTAADMAKTLHYPFTGERLHLGYAGLLGRLSGAGRPAGIQLSIANALWGPYDYNPDFLAVNRDCYAAHVRKIDLVGAEPVINKWAEEQTAGRIKDLIPPRTLDENSVLVLTNAVYFKGEWKFRFKEADTVEEPFQVAPERSVPVKMMHQKGSLRYGTFERADPPGQILELPYKGGELSMVVLLPRLASLQGAQELEKALTADKLDAWLEGMHQAEVRVSLPRFKIEGKTFSVKKPLIDLGMRRAFSGGADFSGMGNFRAWIDEVLHQAFVEVNEEGAEAAAASAVIMKKDRAERPPEPIEFKADHPFLFLLRDNRTGAVLFLGRFSSP